MIDESSNRAKERFQFGLLDLFGLMTLVALVSAIAMPLLRDVSMEDRLKLATLVSVQLLLAVIGFGRFWYLRRRFLSNSGEWIGIGYCGHIRWQHWPIVKSCFQMSLVAIAQLGIALAFTFLPSSGTVSLLQSFFFQLQLGLFTGYALFRFFCRVYPNSLEFFESGVLHGGVVTVPWNRIDLRRSTLFDDRIVVVIRPEARSIVGDTKVVQVVDSVRERLLARHDA